MVPPVAAGSYDELAKYVRKPINKRCWEHYENTSQFEGAERIVETFGVTRHELDALDKHGGLGTIVERV